MLSWFTKDKGNKVRAEVKADPNALIRNALLGGSRELAEYTDVTLAERMYRNVVLFRCISQIAHSMSTVQFYIDRNGRSNAAEDEAVLSLLRRPNPMWSGQAWLYFMSASYLIGGNAFSSGVRGMSNRVLELWPVHFRNVEIKRSRAGMNIASYNYTKGGNSVPYPVDQSNGQTNMLHWWMPNLEDDDKVFGVGPARVANESTFLMDAMQERISAYLTNSPMISGIVSPSAGEALSDKEWDLLVETLQSFTMGGNRAAKFAVFNKGGLKIEKVSMDVIDLISPDSKNSIARDICMPFGLPPMLIGLPGDNTYANMGEARRAFWLDVLLPWYAQPLANALTHFLYGHNSKVKVCVDVDGIDAVKEYRTKFYQAVAVADFLTVDEKRAMCGFDPLGPAKGGDLVTSVERAEVIRANAEALGKPIKKPSESGGPKDNNNQGAGSA